MLHIRLASSVILLVIIEVYVWHLFDFVFKVYFS